MMQFISKMIYKARKVYQKRYSKEIAREAYIADLYKKMPRWYEDLYTVESEVYSPIVDDFTERLMAFVVTFVIIVLSGVAAAIIYSNPDGLAGFVGVSLAGVCSATGQCNFSGLLASFTIASVTLFGFVWFTMWSVWGAIEAGGKLPTPEMDGIETVNENLLLMKMMLEDLRDQIEIDREEADATPIQEEEELEEVN